MREVGAPPLRIGVIGARGVERCAGGIETYCAHFYRHLSSELFETTIFVSRPVDEDMGLTVSVKRTPCWLTRRLEKPSHSLAAVLMSHAAGIRLLHVHGISSCLILPLARMLGMSAIVRHMGPEYERAKWGVLGEAALRVGELFAALFADSVVCLTEDIARSFSAATGRRDKVHVIANGVAVPEVVETDALARLKLEPGEFVLSVGRLEPEKNQDKLIAAFRRADLPPSARLAIVGPLHPQTSYVRRLQALACEDDRVILPGALFGDDLCMLYRSCRIFALPSSFEGMSFSLLEAAAAGATIVASDIFANAAVCRGFGRLYPTGSVEACAKALGAEWRSQRLKPEIDAQIDVIRRDHNWKAVAAQMEPIFLSAAKRETARATAWRLTKQGELR